MKHLSEILQSLDAHLEHEWEIEPIFETMLVAKRLGDLPVYFRNLKWLWDAQTKKLDEGYNPYFVDWSKIFTPIEAAVWQDLRSKPMGFYPQFPVGKRFIDFADPKLKIGVECDGKKFHNYEKDLMRDIELMSYGWTIYHVKGVDCIAEDLKEEASEKDIEQWMINTSGGLAKAIFWRHYKGEIATKYLMHASAALQNHLYIGGSI